MKLCRLNIEKDNASWSPFEPDEHFDKRRTILVADDYNFNTQNDTDVTSDAAAWDKHFRRLGINYYHFLKIIQGIIIPKCCPNYPTLDYSEISDLSEDEKRIGTIYHVLPYSYRVSNDNPYKVTDSVDAYNWSKLLDFSKKGRYEIAESMRSAVGERVRLGLIALTQTQHFFRDVYLMIEFYISSSDPEFKVFIKSIDDTLLSGYNHSSNGMNSKDYWSQELEDLIYSIYSGQNYI